MGFTFEKQNLEGLILIKSQNNTDFRGYLTETYRKDVFIQNGIDIDFVQENFSYSTYKTLRGLHFQKDLFAQDKLIYVQHGSIIDVVVDIRRESKTFGKYSKFVLDSTTPSFLFIPKGFAHGYVTLSDFACVSYKLSEYYNPDMQSGIIWNDKYLDIDWEIDFEPIISEKDTLLPDFKKVFEL